MAKQYQEDLGNLNNMENAIHATDKAIERTKNLMDDSISRGNKEDERRYKNQIVAQENKLKDQQNKLSEMSAMVDYSYAQLQELVKYNKSDVGFSSVIDDLISKMVGAGANDQSSGLGQVKKASLQLQDALRQLGIVDEEIERIMSRSQLAISNNAKKQTDANTKAHPEQS